MNSPWSSFPIKRKRFLEDDSDNVKRYIKYEYSWKTVYGERLKKYDGQDILLIPKDDDDNYKKGVHKKFYQRKD